MTCWWDGREGHREIISSGNTQIVRSVDSEKMSFAACPLPEESRQEASCRLAHERVTDSINNQTLLACKSRLIMPDAKLTLVFPKPCSTRERTSLCLEALFPLGVSGVRVG